MDAPDRPVRRRRKTRVTITDVAQQAQVSVASVSRFINAPASVSQEMAERIAGALAKTGFRMRRTGPMAAAAPTASLGLVVLLTMGEYTARIMAGLPALPQLLEGLGRGIASAGAQLVYLHLDGRGPLPEVLTDGSVAGILVYGALDPLPEGLWPILTRIPSVWVMRRHTDPQGLIDHVFYDNARVGRLAGDYLAGQQARRWAFLNALTDHDAYRQREQGFLATAAALGIPAKAYHAEVGNLRSAVLAALAETPRPDGFFLPSDEQLLEAHHILQELGLAPDRQIHLIGCNNDQHLMVRMHPRPATIDIHLELLGERAVDQLVYRRNHPTAPPMQVFLNPTVVAGERP